MVKKNLLHTDISDRMEAELGRMLDKIDKEKEDNVEKVVIDEALQEDRVYKVEDNRSVVRVLLISRNTELLNPVKQSLENYIKISDLFDELHILILMQGKKVRNPVLRIDDNVWVYIATSNHWWGLIKAGINMAEIQLTFANGFRPDLIVARDPFESAMVAILLQARYKKSIQLHILENFLSVDFLKRSRTNFIRRLLPGFTIPKFSSVRTITENMRVFLDKKYDIKDLKMLPRFQNYKNFLNFETSLNLVEKYKGFEKFILFVNKSNNDDTLFLLLKTLQPILLTDRKIALVVLVDDKNKSEFEKQAKVLNIDLQVIFQKETIDIRMEDYIKAATVLVVLDTDNKNEELVLKSAAIGTPMVLAKSEAREDIFVHRYSAFFCSLENPSSVTEGVATLLNDPGLRNKFSVLEKKIIKELFHDNQIKYQEAYRTSIEESMFVEEDTGVDSAQT